MAAGNDQGKELNITAVPSEAPLGTFHVRVEGGEDMSSLNSLLKQIERQGTSNKPSEEKKK